MFFKHHHWLPKQVLNTIGKDVKGLVIIFYYFITKIIAYKSLIYMVSKHSQWS
jgi:hypothetical protein